MRTAWIGFASPSHYAAKGMALSKIVNQMGRVENIVNMNQKRFVNQQIDFATPDDLAAFIKSALKSPSDQAKESLLQAAYMWLVQRMSLDANSLESQDPETLAGFLTDVAKLWAKGDVRSRLQGLQGSTFHATGSIRAIPGCTLDAD